MQLVLYPDPVLRRRAAPIETVDDDVRERIQEMFEVMYRERGVGLAAPQVGWSARLFIVNTEAEPDPAHEKVYINPEIVSAEGEDLDEEGCLSFPNIRGRVLRRERVRVRALGIDGKVFEEDVEDLEARAVQHELDHLDGILFITRMSVTDRLRAGKELKRLEKEYKKGRLQVGR